METSAVPPSRQNPIASPLRISAAHHRFGNQQVSLGLGEQRGHQVIGIVEITAGHRTGRLPGSLRAETLVVVPFASPTWVGSQFSVLEPDRTCSYVADAMTEPASAYQVSPGGKTHRLQAFRQACSATACPGTRRAAVFRPDVPGGSPSTILSTTYATLPRCH